MKFIITESQLNLLVEESFLIKLLKLGGHTEKEVLTLIKDLLDTGLKNGVRITDDLGKLRVTKNVDEIMNAIKSGKIEARELATVNVNIMRKTSNPTIKRQIANDIVSNQSTIEKFSKKSESEIYETLVSNKWSEEDARIIVDEYKKNGNKFKSEIPTSIKGIPKDLTYFETSQGSKYIRNSNGQVRRWKSNHAFTGGEDMGLHSWSNHSIFIPPKFETEANSLQILIGRGNKTAIAKNSDGKLVIQIYDESKWRPATYQDAFPNFVKRNPETKNKTIMFEYSKEPKMGYNVVDFDLKPNSTRIESYHFGSPVSKISPNVPEDVLKIFFPSYF